MFIMSYSCVGVRLVITVFSNFDSNRKAMIKTRVASSKLNKRDVPLHNTRLFYVGVSIILLNEQSIDFLNNFHL